ncbi:phospholipase-like protein [Tanacetum coccineum]
MENYEDDPGQSQPKLMEVPEHYGLSDFDFSFLQNTELMIRVGPLVLVITVAKKDFTMIDEVNKFVIEDRFSFMRNVGWKSRPTFMGCVDIDLLNLRWSTIHVIDSLNNPHRKKQLMDHISKWTNVLNVLLEKAGHFERIGRQPYNFELVYNDGLEFTSPQQGNSSDCGVVTYLVPEEAGFISNGFGNTLDLGVSGLELVHKERVLSPAVLGVAGNWFKVFCDRTTGCIMELNVDPKSSLSRSVHGSLSFY